MLERLEITIEHFLKTKSAIWGKLKKDNNFQSQLSTVLGKIISELTFTMMFIN